MKNFIKWLERKKYPYEVNKSIGGDGIIFVSLIPNPSIYKEVLNYLKRYNKPKNIRFAGNYDYLRVDF